MKTHALAAAVTLLAGCAQTPSEIRAHGTTHQHESTQTPAAAANCMAKNAPTMGRFIAQLQDVEANGARELFVYGPGGDGLQLWAVARAEPDRKGAVVSMSVLQYVMAPGTFAAALFKGC